MWVIMKHNPTMYDRPAKVFDDRKDARRYCERMNERSRMYTYYYRSVKRG